MPPLLVTAAVERIAILHAMDLDSDATLGAPSPAWLRAVLELLWSYRQHQYLLGLAVQGRLAPVADSVAGRLTAHRVAMYSLVLL